MRADSNLIVIIKISKVKENKTNRVVLAYISIVDTSSYKRSVFQILLAPVNPKVVFNRDG
jgi:hypothetical protein